MLSCSGGQPRRTTPPEAERRGDRKGGSQYKEWVAALSGGAKEMFLVRPECDGRMPSSGPGAVAVLLE